MTPTEQQSLFDWKPKPAVERAFHAFDQENPRIWHLFCHFAWDRIRLGFKHYSADAILHRIRWETDAEQRDGSGFKANNNFTSLYARKWAREFPDHADFFRMRRSKFDGGAHAA